MYGTQGVTGPVSILGFLLKENYLKYRIKIKICEGQGSVQCITNLVCNAALNKLDIGDILSW